MRLGLVIALCAAAGRAQDERGVSGRRHRIPRRMHADARSYDRDDATTDAVADASAVVVHGEGVTAS